MAGKTFPGIGDLEDESPPLDPADAADSNGDAQFYSGPTVVDEAKVEQGLKKLRSLDAPPGPMTGIHRAVADALDDPRITPQVTVPGTLMMPEFTIDPARGTAVGRSVSGPLPGQQTTQPFDDRALRGTMFGHSVHLPDLDRAARAKEVETSKALAIVERGGTTTNEIAIFQPGYSQHGGIPLGQDAYPGPPRSNRFHPRETPIDLRTVSPRKKLILRVSAATACIGAIVVAALLWVRSTSEEAETAVRPTAALPAPAPPSPRPIDVAPLPPQPVAPSPPAAEITSPPAPAAAPKLPTRIEDDDLPTSAFPAHPKPATVGGRQVAPRAATTTTAPAGIDAPPASTRPAHATAAKPERHHSTGSKGARDDGQKVDKGDKPDQAEAPARPSRGKRAVEDDPDATMAPTIE
jgi:hypothetical protein